MNKPVLTRALELDGFRRATQTFANAGERWQERAAKGLNDEDLAAAIKFELGIQGGSYPLEGPAIEYIGNGLRVWVSWGGCQYQGKPNFQGAASIAAAREIYGIADPSQGDLFR